MKNKLMRIAVSLGMALTMLMSTALSVSAAAPVFEEIEHKGKGRMEVEFYGKVVYKNAKVIVRDTSGKKYKVTKVRKDDDDIKFTIKNFKRGKTYKITVKGIKKRGTKSYGSRTGKINIPKSSKSSISRDKAVAIAKKHAKKKWGATSFWDVDCDKEGGRWEVAFEGKCKGVVYEFEYDIATKGGKILHSSRERD